jgi:hypothetical protein
VRRCEDAGEIAGCVSDRARYCHRPTSMTAVPALHPWLITTLSGRGCDRQLISALGTAATRRGENDHGLDLDGDFGLWLPRSQVHDSGGEVAMLSGWHEQLARTR